MRGLKREVREEVGRVYLQKEKQELVQNEQKRGECVHLIAPVIIDGTSSECSCRRRIYEPQIVNQ